MGKRSITAYKSASTSHGFGRASPHPRIISLGEIHSPRRSTPNGSLIDEIVREGARRMLAAALEAEVNAYIAELAGERDESGIRLVVRNGHHHPRKVEWHLGWNVELPRGCFLLVWKTVLRA